MGKQRWYSGSRAFEGVAWAETDRLLRSDSIALFSDIELRRLLNGLGPSQRVGDAIALLVGIGWLLEEGIEAKLGLN